MDVVRVINLHRMAANMLRLLYCLEIQHIPRLKQPHKSESR